VCGHRCAARCWQGSPQRKRRPAQLCVSPHVQHGMLASNALDCSEKGQVLNLLRVEDLTPEIMIERSFFQFQNNSSLCFVGNLRCHWSAAIPEIEAKLQAALRERDSLSIPNEEQVLEYSQIRNQLTEHNRELQAIINDPKYCLPFLQVVACDILHRISDTRSLGDLSRCATTRPSGAGDALSTSRRTQNSRRSSSCDSLATFHPCAGRKAAHSS
jgi:hypothetical protein